MSDKIWNQNEIKEMLATNDVMVERAVLSIFKRQTDDEQRTASTRVLNNIGFNAFDAEILTSFAHQLIDRPGYHLSFKQMRIARKRIAKYARQLTDIANEGKTIPPTPKEAAKKASQLWTKHGTSVYSIEMSELETLLQADDEGQPTFLSPSGNNEVMYLNDLTPHRDDEGEIKFWTGLFGEFTVKVFND